MKIYQSLSQNHLNLFETCPPLFQKKYLEQISFLPSVIQEERSEWGKKFHLLMQQYNLGLPLDNFDYDDVTFQQSLQALIAETQNIWTSSEVLSREAEYKLQLKFNNYIFTVIYDLLILYKDRGIIYDWKTFLQPENEKKLINNWQTKLYLYVLTEKMNYKPSQLSITYWFVKLPHKTQSLTIKYNEVMHKKNRQEIENIVNQIDKSLSHYLKNNVDFDHVANCQKKCPYYQSLIENNLINNSTDKLDHLPDDLEEIKEINPF
ncbi:PD-(D/E)XK nuclease family protein [Cyanobacterium stanieri LEGE 03274]|uniref:PD-(D/E)XK nuclease family protein n=1 Tax=Cyanobacterium stanieri LEGE 03274 TaxID=1828756 RepID=A0ABR9V3N6_9CHRO|nr:PD-(D/E)XK nuclease family protein [Cyanobacterium stanieri LEGE 03274]